MASSLYHSLTRITSSATWTAVATPAAGQELLVDVVIANWTANNNTVLVAIKTSSPSADTDAILKRILKKSPALNTDDSFEAYLSSVLLKDGETLYVKSDQTDTRVDVTGVSQTVPA